MFLSAIMGSYLGSSFVICNSFHTIWLLLWPSFLVHEIINLFCLCFVCQILHRGVFSLAIQNLHIESLGLRSLRSVSGGLVLLHNNSQLCYTNSLPWETLLHPTQGPHRIVSKNRDPQICGREHSNVTMSVCWIDCDLHFDRTLFSFQLN